MSITGIAGVAAAVPAPTREEMAAIVAARPAVLQQQAAAAQVVGSGTSGEGTPAVDTSGSVDFYL